MNFPAISVPIVEIPIQSSVKLFMKREDLIHPQISGNKYWKLKHSIEDYCHEQVDDKLIITFGGAFSNHIASTAAIGKLIDITTLGIIRGEELETTWRLNPTLQKAHENGMKFRFVSREIYRDKQSIAEQLRREFPNALIIPEGGTNEAAVSGVKGMLTLETQDFDYLCTAVGTGGTVSGLSRYALPHQKVLGFLAVKDPSLEETIRNYSSQNNFTLWDASDGGYGKITDENIRFINSFYHNFGIPLDPVYTGKMMRKLLVMVEADFFPENSRILAFHTGGLQGIAGTQELLAKNGRPKIDFGID